MCYQMTQSTPSYPDAVRPQTWRGTPGQIRRQVLLHELKHQIDANFPVCYVVVADVQQPATHRLSLGPLCLPSLLELFLSSSSVFNNLEK